MPLFRKSHKKDDPVVNTTTARHDPTISGSGADPKFMRNDQLGANSGPGTGLAPSQYPHPNEAGYPGTGVQDPHNKPSKIGGKVQTAIGTMVGSDTLRAKGMEKEREARDLNAQSNELAQAESLEREAQMHRDRAMGGGDRNPVIERDSRRFNY